MNFLLTDSTRPTEFWLGATMLWWGFWLLGPAESYVLSQTGVTQFLSWVFPLSVWGALLAVVGLGQCSAVCYQHWSRTFFAGMQFLLWLFLTVVFGLAQFYTMALVICPIYLIVIVWTFLRLCFSSAEEYSA